LEGAVYLFSDIHMHLLFGTDDGAKTVEDMYEMVDASYACGTRFICATPHFYPGYFGDNRETSKTAFAASK
jgi:protein-tyrosine phosphatase